MQYASKKSKPAFEFHVGMQAPNPPRRSARRMAPRPASLSSSVVADSRRIGIMLAEDHCISRAIESRSRRSSERDKQSGPKEQIFPKRGQAIREWKKQELP